MGKVTRTYLNIGFGTNNKEAMVDNRAGSDEEHDDKSQKVNIEDNLSKKGRDVMPQKQGVLMASYFSNMR